MADLITFNYPPTTSKWLHLRVEQVLLHPPRVLILPALVAQADKRLGAAQVDRHRMRVTGMQIVCHLVAALPSNAYSAEPSSAWVSSLSTYATFQ